jgi:hypothetical protein
VSRRQVEDGSGGPSVVTPASDGHRPPPDAVDVRVLVRLLLAAADGSVDDAPRLTNDAAIDGLARRLVEAVRNADHRTRTAEMALRDLVWRVDTARVMIEPKLQEVGCGELADLLATDDIHALLRDLG